MTMEKPSKYIHQSNYIKKRYRDDPVFREKVKERSRKRWQKIKNDPEIIKHKKEVNKIYRDKLKAMGIKRKR